MPCLDICEPSCWRPHHHLTHKQTVMWVPCHCTCPTCPTLTKVLRFHRCCCPNPNSASLPSVPLSHLCHSSNSATNSALPLSQHCHYLSTATVPPVPPSHQCHSPTSATASPAGGLVLPSNWLKGPTHATVPLVRRSFKSY